MIGMSLILGVWVSLIPSTIGAGSTLPPERENAALLYYQAFLLCPEADPNMASRIDRAFAGARVTEEIIGYMDRARQAIDLAETASQMPTCNWGIPHLDGGASWREPRVHIRRLVKILGLDARILADEGNHRAALRRCLTMRRLASHVGDDSIPSYAFSLMLDAIALSRIQDTLGRMPPNTEDLTWLQGQLAATGGGARPPARALLMDLAHVANKMRRNTEGLASTRDFFARHGNTVGTETQDLTDERILALSRKPYDVYLQEALRAMAVDMAYVDVYAEIERLKSELNDQAGENPATRHLIMMCAENVPTAYGLYVRYTARFNALQTAIEVYRAHGDEGQLPSVVPDCGPKDPYSGRPFEFRLTEIGFRLRCRGEDIGEERTRQYEFALTED